MVKSNWAEAAAFSNAFVFSALELNEILSIKKMKFSETKDNTVSKKKIDELPYKHRLDFWIIVMIVSGYVSYLFALNLSVMIRKHHFM